MSRLSDIFDNDYFNSRYHFADRSRHYPAADIPFRRTLRCYRNADDYLNPRIFDVESTGRKVNIDKDCGFEVCLDVQHFKPEEISVKAEKSTIVVQAKHEEKQDEHGFVSRQFTRRYELPSEYKAEDVFSSLSSDGILTIKCAKPAAESEEARSVPIKQTGLPSQSKEKSTEDKKDGKETPVA